MDYFEDLKTLLSISSRTNDELGNPNKEGTDKAGEFVKTLLSELPLKWTKIEKTDASNFWIAESIDKDHSLPRVLFSVHVDTVFKAEDIKVWEDDQKIYGSGSQDMKANIIVMVETLKSLHKKGIFKNIVLYISPEEETATQNYREEIKAISKNIDYAFVMESTLDNELNASMNRRSIVVSRKGFRMYNLTIKGPGGHSGVILEKENRHSTILLASEIIQRLEGLADYNKETTFNPGLIHGGEAINVLATQTKMSFEFRFRTNDEHKRIIKAVKALVKEYNEKGAYTLELGEHRFYPPFEITESDKNFVNLCHETAKELNIDLVEERRGGGSEACIIKYFNPEASVLDGFGARGDGQHTLDEWVYKDSITSSIEYLNLVVSKLQDQKVSK